MRGTKLNRYLSFFMYTFHLLGTKPPTLAETGSADIRVSIMRESAKESRAFIDSIVISTPEDRRSKVQAAIELDDYYDRVYPDVNEVHESTPSFDNDLPDYM